MKSDLKLSLSSYLIERNDKRIYLDRIVSQLLKVNGNLFTFLATPLICTMMPYVKLMIGYADGIRIDVDVNDDKDIDDDVNSVISSK